VQLEFYTEDGPEPSDTVWAESPAVKHEALAKKRPLDPLAIDNLMVDFSESDPDYRPVTLRVNRMRVEVHHVQSVTVTAESHSVDRHETQRSDPK
jgi:hypothetical protein